MAKPKHDQPLFFNTHLQVDAVVWNPYDKYLQFHYKVRATAS